MLSANQFHLQFATPISTSSVVGPDWPNYKYMLVVMTDDQRRNANNVMNAKNVKLVKPVRMLNKKNATMPLQQLSSK